MRIKLAVLFTMLMIAVGVQSRAELHIADEPQSARARQAVEKVLPLLQQSARTWLEKQSCSSCHHQGLGMMTVAVARERGFRIDEAMLAEQLAKTARAVALQPSQSVRHLIYSLPNSDYLGLSYALIGLSSGGLARSRDSDLVVHSLLGSQHVAGYWTPYPSRLPMEGSKFSQTATTIRALRLFTPPGRLADAQSHILRARAWLTKAAPRETEDLVMQLLGLAWSDGDARDIAHVKDQLLRMQRPDGGWAQIPTRASDAYATGQALVALNQAGRLSPTHPAFKRGIAFLLTTQKADGSWLVETRHTWQPDNQYFESGFPYGKHQFISYAATAWATLALALSQRNEISNVLMGNARKATSDEATNSPAGTLTPLMRAALFGTLAELQKLLRDGADVNATATPLGMTALMCAVHDPAKAALLVSAGANVNAATTTGHTALLLAANYDGAAETVKLLLERGADVHARPARPQRMNMALHRAALRGDQQVIALLLKAGATLNDLPKGSNALIAAIHHGDAATVSFLLDRGADIETRSPDSRDAHADSTPLMWAVNSGFPDLVKLLLKRGAAVNAHDATGMTPLIYAAGAIDCGNTEIIEALLAAGAEPQARTSEEDTALAFAERYGKSQAAAVLRKAATARKENR